MKTNRQFPKLGGLIGRADEINFRPPVKGNKEKERKKVPREENLQRMVYDKLCSDNSNAVVILRWTGHSEPEWGTSADHHFSNFFAEFDVACATKTKRSPILFGYEVKWKPSYIYTGEGQASWLLEQDASYAFIVRPPPSGEKEKIDRRPLIEHIRRKEYIGLYFVEERAGQLYLNDQTPRSARPKYPYQRNMSFRIDRLRFNLYCACEIPGGKDDIRGRPWVTSEYNRIKSKKIIQRIKKMDLPIPSGER